MASQATPAPPGSAGCGGEAAIGNYQALCRELTRTGPFGELSTVGARSVLRRYSDAWFQAAKRRKAGQQDAGFPRRKRAQVPVRLYHGTFAINGQRVRLPVAKGRPALWVRLARPCRTRMQTCGR